MIQIHKSNNFLLSLSDDIVQEFEYVSKSKWFNAGSYVAYIGDRRQYIYQAIRGNLKYCAYDSHGREMITAMITAGDWIGLTEVFSGKPAMANVVAMSDVQLRAIDHRDFDAILNRHPIILRHLLQIFVSRFDFVYRIAQDRNELTLKERLLKLLFSLSRETSDIRASQDDLAKMLPASRQALNRLLKELEQEGVLQRGYRSIRVLRPLFEDNTDQL